MEVEKIPFPLISCRIRTEQLISHASKVMVTILQARLQQYVNRELPDVQAEFRKGRGTRVQIASIHCIIEKAREFQKNICFVDYTKAFDCVDYNKLWKILKEMRIPDHLTCLLKNLYVGQEATEPYMKQQTSSRLGKGLQQCLSPAYLTYMQSTSWEMPGCRTHKLESIFLGGISTTSDMQRTPQLWKKVKNLRVSWWRWKRRVKKLTWNSTFKINLVWKSAFKIWHLVFSLHGKEMG